MQSLCHSAIGKQELALEEILLSLAASVSAEKQKIRLTVGGREGKQIIEENGQRKLNMYRNRGKSQVCWFMPLITHLGGGGRRIVTSSNPA